MILNNKNLAIIILTLSMLVLTGLSIFLIVHKKKDSCGDSCGLTCPPNGIKKWKEVSEKAGKTDETQIIKDYATFCDNPTNDNWIKEFNVGSDPNKNGFYEFLSDCSTGYKSKFPTPPCKSPNDFIKANGTLDNFHTACCSSNMNRMKLLGDKDEDPNTNGYNDYCVKTSSPDPDIPRSGLINCATCAYSNKEWMNINRISDPDPNTNGYYDFCMNSLGSESDWFKKVVPMLPPLPKGTNANDPKINGYNKFCGK